MYVYVYNQQRRTMCVCVRVDVSLQCSVNDSQLTPVHHNPMPTHSNVSSSMLHVDFLKNKNNTLVNTSHCCQPQQTFSRTIQFYEI